MTWPSACVVIAAMPFVFLIFLMMNVDWGQDDEVPQSKDRDD